MNATPSSLTEVEVEIRIEARFVLWALRCCAHREAGSPEATAREVARGFELADALETLDRFWRFAQALCDAMDSPAVWHHPTCDCVSAEEMQVLTALSHLGPMAPESVPCTAGPGLRARESVPQPAGPWLPLIGADYALLVDSLARQWLHALRRAGICYPPPGELVRAGSALQYAGLPVPPQRH